MGSPLQHGGGLDAAAARFGIPKEAWLDLSTGINPVPYPVPALGAADWGPLPDRAAAAALIAAARSYYGVPDAAAIVAAPGTQALIQMIPRLRAPGRVAVFGPTYTEHAHCWAAAGHEVMELALDAPWPDAADVVVLVNPNNPDGHRWLPTAIAAQIHPDRLLIIDEAFADVMPAISVVPETAGGGLVVLRSFGKFFGLAGLRLGFAVTNAAFGASLESAIGPWAVAGPALEIGARALGDTAWITSTRRRLAEDAARLDVAMAAHVKRHLGGTDLYRLYDTGDANVHGHLARQGIWTRPFDGRPGLLRLGLPASEADFGRLATALAAPAGVALGAAHQL